MPEGTIKKIVSDRGFGFISTGGANLFFHHSALQGISIEDLQEGQRVQHEEGEGPKGPRAESVRPV